MLLTNEPNLLKTFKRENLDLNIIMVFDYLLNSIFGGQIAYTRQLESFLSQKRSDFKTILVSITNELVSFDKLPVPVSGIEIMPYDFARGWTSSSRLTYKRISPLTPIDDATEAGISLKNITNYNASDTFSLAHEIGHLLIRSANDHIRDDNGEWKEKT